MLGYYIIKILEIYLECSKCSILETMKFISFTSQLLPTYMKKCNMTLVKNCMVLL